MKVANTYIACFESTNPQFDDEYYKIHELVNGDFIKESSDGKLSKIHKNAEIILKITPKNILADYSITQTPIERLRNKLSPFMTLVELLSMDGSLSIPFDESKCDGKFKNDIYERLLKTCSEYKDDIKKNLSDCEDFYDK